jgi:hypothetical protein
MRARITTVAAGLGAAVLLYGCGRQAVEIDPYESAAAGRRWNAVLATPSQLSGVAQVQGTAWLGPAEDMNQTDAFIHLRNATPGGKHPWHVHRGTCGDDQGIVGEASDYEMLEVGGNGEARKTATLDMALPGQGDGPFMVNVHASEGNLGTVIACGNLSPPIR